MLNDLHSLLRWNFNGKLLMVGKACEWLGSGAHSTKRLQMELAFFFFLNTLTF